MSRPIRFERQWLPSHQCTVVALDARLSDFQGKPVMVNGKPMVRLPEKTVKDCRKIDGCVYLHLGHVSDSLMVQLIETYQKAKDNKEWQNNESDPLIPDDKFNLGL